MTPDPELRRFAFRIAGPRDFVINFVINGLIAWFVFGKNEAVTLAGPDSIFNMLLPMSAIEGTLTSFFGLLNGVQDTRKRTSSAIVIKWNRWAVSAVVYSLIRGIVTLLVFVAAKILIQLCFPATTIPTHAIPIIIGVISGLLAFVLHSWAVLDSAEVGRPHETSQENRSR